MIKIVIAVIALALFALAIFESDNDPFDQGPNI